VQFRFSAPLWHWRGPAPYHFVTVPAGPSAEIAASAAELTYGWGMVPVTVELGRTRWTTSLWPKDGGYVLPIKAAVRRAERLDLDDVADVLLVVEAGRH
jgi:hypothetical protein